MKTSADGPLSSASSLLRRARLGLFAALGLAVALQLYAAEGRLVIVSEPPQEFVLTRGEVRTFAIKVHYTGDDKLQVDALYFRYKSQQQAQPPQDNLPEVIGLDGLTINPNETTTIALKFPAYANVAEYEGEIYVRRRDAPEGKPFYSFRIKIKEVERRLLDSKTAGWLAAALALLVAIITRLVRLTVGGRRMNFFQSPDGFYSVSRFQVWLWTITVLFSYGYLFFSRGDVIFPDSIWALMGISVGSIGAATAISAKNGGTTVPVDSPPVSPPELSFLKSMLSEDGKPSIMRLQMFAWTIATVVFFVWHVYNAGTLWDVPTNLLFLMGISHGGYLVDKAAKK